MRRQQLAEVGLAQPAVHPGADLEADLGRDAAGAAEPPGQVDLPEAPFAEEPPDPVGVAGVGTGEDLVGGRQARRLARPALRSGCGWGRRSPPAGGQGRSDAPHGSSLVDGLCSRQYPRRR